MLEPACAKCAPESTRAPSTRKWKVCGPGDKPVSANSSVQRRPPPTGLSAKGSSGFASKITLTTRACTAAEGSSGSQTTKPISAGVPFRRDFSLATPAGWAAILGASSFSGGSSSKPSSPLGTRSLASSAKHIMLGTEAHRLWRRSFAAPTVSAIRSGSADAGFATKGASKVLASGCGAGCASRDVSIEVVASLFAASGCVGASVFFTASGCGGAQASFGACFATAFSAAGAAVVLPAPSAELDASSGASACPNQGAGAEAWAMACADFGHIRRLGHCSQMLLPSGSRMTNLYSMPPAGQSPVPRVTVHLGYVSGPVVSSGPLLGSQLPSCAREPVTWMLLPGLVSARTASVTFSG
mmetsp:Transcript_119674/g.343794  ORF Transcript_119674/g.343794 Transcript_119674/m.343794 type:complete len:356 (+) Transcript_119674:1053-2120(+)